VTTQPKAESALRATLFDDDGRDRQVDLDGEPLRVVGDSKLLWVDVDARDEARIDAIRASAELTDEVADLLASDERAPHVLRYPDHVLLRLVALQPADPAESQSSKAADVTSAAIDIIVGRNLVITVHEGRIKAFDDFQDHVRGDSRLGALEAADFLTILVDSVVAVYQQLAEGVERRIDALDELAVRGSREEAFLAEVVSLRRRVAVLRRALAPHAWAFSQLARPDFELEGVGKPWPGVVARLDRAIDAVENARELLMGAFDVYMARSAQRTNDVMKALTIISAVLLPAVVIGGVMGMNFKIGFFDDPGNFWLAVGTMLALAVGVIGVSRWRGWI
jgi:Mg2+ and Co2+ transporter CorA